LTRAIYGETFIKNSLLESLQLSKNPLEIFSASSLHGLLALRTLSVAYVPTERVTIEEDAFRDLTVLRKLDIDSSPGLISAILESDALMTSLNKVLLIKINHLNIEWIIYI